MHNLKAISYLLLIPSAQACRRLRSFLSRPSVRGSENFPVRWSSLEAQHLETEAVGSIPVVPGSQPADFLPGSRYLIQVERTNTTHMHTRARACAHTHTHTHTHTGQTFNASTGEFKKVLPLPGEHMTCINLHLRYRLHAVLYLVTHEVSWS